MGWSCSEKRRRKRFQHWLSSHQIERTAAQSPRGMAPGWPCGPGTWPNQAATAAGNSLAFHPAGALWDIGAGCQLSTGRRCGHPSPPACCTQKIPAGTRVSQGEEARHPAEVHVPATPSLYQAQLWEQLHPTAKTTANQLHSVSSTCSQACSPSQFPQLPKSYLPKAWQEPGWAILHLGATPTVTSPVWAAPQQPLPGRMGGQQAAPACPLARLSRLGGRREPS